MLHQNPPSFLSCNLGALHSGFLLAVWLPFTCQNFGFLTYCNYIFVLLLTEMLFVVHLQMPAHPVKCGNHGREEGIVCSHTARPPVLFHRAHFLRDLATSLSVMSHDSWRFTLRRMKIIFLSQKGNERVILRISDQLSASKKKGSYEIKLKLFSI